MAEDRAHNPARQPKFPEVSDIQEAISAGKVTKEEGYDLAGVKPDTAHEMSDHPLGSDYKIHQIDTPIGKSERSRKISRATHKRAGLEVQPRKGY